jgi:hypothetical protein
MTHLLFGSDDPPPSPSGPDLPPPSTTAALRRGGTRPRRKADIVELVLRMARERASCGYTRIRGAFVQPQARARAQHDQAHPARGPVSSPRPSEASARRGAPSCARTGAPSRDGLLHRRSRDMDYHRERNHQGRRKSFSWISRGAALWRCPSLSRENNSVLQLFMLRVQELPRRTRVLGGHKGLRVWVPS